MTTKKYKKLLMSEGLDRNLAEMERQKAAGLRSENKLLADRMMEGYVGTVNSLRLGLGVNYRTFKKNVHWILRNAVVV